MPAEQVVTYSISRVFIRVGGGGSALPGAGGWLGCPLWDEPYSRSINSPVNTGFLLCVTHGPHCAHPASPSTPRPSSHQLTPGHPSRAKPRPPRAPFSGNPAISPSSPHGCHCPRSPPAPERTDGPFVPVSAPVLRRLLKARVCFPPEPVTSV